jgi:hypothetical protein
MYAPVDDKDDDVTDGMTNDVTHVVAQQLNSPTTRDDVNFIF